MADTTAPRTTITASERLQLEGLLLIARQHYAQQETAMSAFLRRLGIPDHEHSSHDLASTLSEAVWNDTPRHRGVDWILDYPYSGHAPIKVIPDHEPPHGSTDEREALLYVQQRLQTIRLEVEKGGANEHLTRAVIAASDALQMIDRALA